VLESFSYVLFFKALLCFLKTKKNKKQMITYIYILILPGIGVSHPRAWISTEQKKRKKKRR
jgi:hypothetical protein